MKGVPGVITFESAIDAAHTRRSHTAQIDEVDVASGPPARISKLSFASKPQTTLVSYTDLATNSFSPAHRQTFSFPLTPLAPLRPPVLFLSLSPLR
eukprot:847006-Pleurochrysis_carterae.AAC.1